MGKKNVVAAQGLVVVNSVQAFRQPVGAARQVLVGILPRCGAHLLPVVELQGWQDLRRGLAWVHLRARHEHRRDTQGFRGFRYTHGVAQVVSACGLEIRIKQIKALCHSL